MTYKICYWDDISKSQKEREATADEILEIDARKLAALILIVPTPVSRRQIRMALSRTPYGSGTLRTAIESAVAASNQDTKDWYEQSTEFHRSNPVTLAMGVAMGVSPAQLDTLWILASTL